MSDCFRQRLIAFFLERKRLNERLAENMLDWAHSGFSVDGSIRFPAGPAKTPEALAQYVLRAPVSLRNLLVDEGGTDTVPYRAPYSGYSKTDTKAFPVVAFPVAVLQHPPDSRSRLIPTYGLNSSRARGTWSRQPHVVRLGIISPNRPSTSVPPRSLHQRSPSRPIKEVHDADPLCCPRCHRPVKTIAVITDPAQVLRFLGHLVKTGKPPPGLDPTSLD